ncbi:MAG TPA: hypothetical protein VJB68_05065 [Methylophilaceae bacterium]|nr:hypothetical protein [Methylophilaceae bacterium]
MNTKLNSQLIDAINLALNGDWHQAHIIAQESSAPMACWIHAVLHKIEGDEGNSRYWYARAHANYEDYADPNEELKAIAQLLDKN